MAEASELAPLTADQFAALTVCTLLPSSTAGPFPTTEQLDRRDITEGYPGRPLALVGEHEMPGIPSAMGLAQLAAPGDPRVPPTRSWWQRLFGR